jgi:WD40 repeat protein
MKIYVEKLNTLDGHRDCVYTLESGQSDHIFYSAAGDGMIVRWNLDDPENGELLAKMKNSVYAIHYREDENLIIAGQNFEGIHFIDLLSKTETGSVKISNAQIFDIKSFGNKIFVASADGTLYVIDIITRAFIKKVKLSESSIRTIAINQRLGDLALGLSDNTIRVLDLNSLEPKYLVHAHKLSVFSLAYDPISNNLISGSRDAHLKCWSSVNQYKLQESVVAHMYAINAVSISPANDFFLTCSMDKTIKVWDLQNFRLLKVIDKSRYAGHATSVNKVLWANKPGHFLSCSDDKKISVWELRLN